MKKDKNIQVPVFKSKLKKALLKKERMDLERKVSFYKRFAAAALILFLFSLGLGFYWQQSSKKVVKNNEIKENINKYASGIEYSKEFDSKLDKIMINETIKSGKQVYPVKVKNIMVKKVELSNGKTVEMETKIDMSNYANAY